MGATGHRQAPRGEARGGVLGPPAGTGQQRPRLRPSPPGRRVTAPLLPRSVPGALGADPPPATAAGRPARRGCGRKRRPPSGQAPREPGRRGEGPARAQPAALPEAHGPRSAEPAPLLAGGGEIRALASQAGGAPGTPGLWRVDPSAPAAAGRLPSCGSLHSPAHPSPTHTWQRRRKNSEEAAGARLYQGLPPKAALPTRSPVTALSAGTQRKILDRSLDTRMCTHTYTHMHTYNIDNTYQHFPQTFREAAGYLLLGVFPAETIPFPYGVRHSGRSPWPVGTPECEQIWETPGQVWGVESLQVEGLSVAPLCISSPG